VVQPLLLTTPTGVLVLVSRSSGYFIKAFFKDCHCNSTPLYALIEDSWQCTNTLYSRQFWQLLSQHSEHV
jgi:hypothetical protein